MRLLCMFFKPFVCISHVELPLQIFKDQEDCQDFQRSSRIFVNLEDLQRSVNIYEIDGDRYIG